jgi:hypothetical protein
MQISSDRELTTGTDPRQQLAEDRKIGRVIAHVAHRLDEPVAVVGGEVVLADVIGKLVPLDAGQ